MMLCMQKRCNAVRRTVTEMDRLTKRDMTGIPFCQNASYLEMLDKLAAYEDAEEQGRLVVLPCNVGDKLYEIDMKEYGVIVCEALWYTVGKNKYTGETDWSVNVHVVEGHGKGSGYYFTPNDFGKTVFLSRAEAEAALKGE